MSQNFDIVPWWLSHARQNACIGMIQDSSRQMPLECDVNIAVNGFSGFATNPTRTEGSRLNRYQGNSFAFMSSREQIKHSLPTLSAEPLQAHSTLIFAFYCKLVFVIVLWPSQRWTYRIGCLVGFGSQPPPRKGHLRQCWYHALEALTSLNQF